MPTHLRDYEVMKDIKLIDEGLVNFCLFVDCDPIYMKKQAMRSGFKE